MTWKLKRGVTWHDGRPFTADDCVFTWEYASDPATAAYSVSAYRDLRVVKLDDHTVRVEFDRPTPFWADAFVGSRGMILPRHVFAPFKGARSNDAPANLRPVAPAPTPSWSSAPATSSSAAGTSATTSRTDRTSTRSR